MPDLSLFSQNDAPWDLIAVGGGAASFFAAITAAEASEGSRRILILEKSPQVLTKVKVSGGGRCNVTHACFDPREFAAHYPRGEKSLIGPLHRWGAAETIGWFESRGVRLKSEPDGRMFPVTDQSQTIIDCLVHAATDAGVTISTNSSVEAAHPTGHPTHAGERFSLQCQIERKPAALRTRALLLATGGTRSASGERLVTAFGHSVEPAVPSLFTFQIDKDPRLIDLQGLSVADVTLSIRSHKLAAQGPILITHWGLSGPAVLRLSAWGARDLHADGYRFTLEIDWLPGTDAKSEIAALRTSWAKRKVAVRPPFEPLPKRLWERLVAAAGISEKTIWSQLSHQNAAALAAELQGCQIEVCGKSLNKEEFVTCGGVPLPEIDLRTMGSRSVPGLYFAGEILDVDGLTGGFNFQNAWTSGHFAGTAIAQALSSPD